MKEWIPIDVHIMSRELACVAAQVLLSYCIHRQAIITICHVIAYCTAVLCVIEKETMGTR